MRGRRNSISGQFAPRLVEMLEAPAYRVLSVSAHRVIARIEIEFGHHGGTDNGRLPVTFQNFQDYGMDRDAIAPAIRECEALGFIEVTQRGRAGNAEFRSPNLFRLTFRHAKNVLGDGTHEWRQIKTVEEAVQLAKSARKSIKNKNSVGKDRAVRSGDSLPKAKDSSREYPDDTHSRIIPTTLDISGRDQQ